MTITWSRSTSEKYWYALEVLPPAVMNFGGFLVGEPMDHATCAVTGEVLPRYEGWLERGAEKLPEGGWSEGRFYVSSRPLTLPEFRKAAREFVEPKEIA